MLLSLNCSKNLKIVEIQKRVYNPWHPTSSKKTHEMCVEIKAFFSSVSHRCVLEGKNKCMRGRTNLWGVWSLKVDNIYIIGVKLLQSLNRVLFHILYSSRFHNLDFFFYIFLDYTSYMHVWFYFYSYNTSKFWNKMEVVLPLDKLFWKYTLCNSNSANFHMIGNHGELY